MHLEAPYLDTRHPTAEVGGRIAVSDVRDQLEAKLLRMENALQCAICRRMELHRFLHH